MSIRHVTPRSVEVVKLIQVCALRGAGVDGDPVREVVQYWSLDGKLVAERDPSTRSPEEEASNAVELG